MELLDIPNLPVIGGTVDLFFKAIISVAFVFYIIFAFVIVRQVNTMTKTLEVGLESALRLVAVLHLLFSVGAFVAAFIIL
jgi:hypothetical protein